MSIEKIKEATNQILNRVEATKGRGEEATKQALVLPMLSALGYDIWDPREVCPEYDADFAIRKGSQKEKVDIAIFRGDQPIIYIETKSSDCTNLDEHHGQLSRYFNATQSVVLGILTNGVEWRFFTDTTDQNVMDDSPFHTAKLDAIDQGLDVMARFVKGHPIAETTRAYATDLRYTAKIASFLKSAIDLKDRNPDEELVRWILKGEDTEGKLIYPGVVNINVVNRFTPIVKNALTRVIRDIVRRSVSAMDDEVSRTDEPDAFQEPKPCECGESQPTEAPTSESSRKAAIVTTESELLLFGKVKEIFDNAAKDHAVEVFDPTKRRMTPAEVGYKDTSAYFGIYINKPAWWFMRASVESLDSKWSKNWLGFDLPAERVREALPEDMEMLPPSAFAETRVVVRSIDDIHRIENIVLMAIDQEIQRHQASNESDNDPVQV